MDFQAKAVHDRAERLEAFVRFRQGGTPAAVASRFGGLILGVLIDRIVAVEVQLGDRGIRREVAVRRECSGSTSHYRLEVVR